MSRTTIMMTVSATAVMTVLLTGGAVYAADLADDEIFKRVIADWKRMSDPDKISQLEVKWGDWFDSLNDTAKRQAYVDTSIERDQIRAEMTAYETRHKYIEASIEVMLGEPANNYPVFSDVSYLDKLAEKISEPADKELKKENKKLKKKIEKKQDKINDLEEQIKEKDKKIKKLKKTVSRQQDNIQDMKAQMGEGTDKNEEETLPESDPITTNSTNIEAAAADVIAQSQSITHNYTHSLELLGIFTDGIKVKDASGNTTEPTVKWDKEQYKVGDTARAVMYAVPANLPDNVTENMQFESIRHVSTFNIYNTGSSFVDMKCYRYYPYDLEKFTNWQSNSTFGGNISFDKRQLVEFEEWGRPGYDLKDDRNSLDCQNKGGYQGMSFSRQINFTAIGTLTNNTINVEMQLNHPGTYWVEMGYGAYDDSNKMLSGWMRGGITVTE